MFTVAIIGPDGAGKTTVAGRVQQSLPSAAYVYMGENPDASNEMSPVARYLWQRRRQRGRLPSSGGPPPLDRRQARSPLRGFVHLVVLLTEEWYRQWRARQLVKQGTIVLFDRHFVADYWAHDVTGPERPLSRRIHGALLRLYPRPALTVLLDAPAEVLFDRKPEGTLDELTVRRNEYLRFVAAHPSVRVVDATRSLDTVQREVTDLVMAHARQLSGGR